MWTGVKLEPWLPVAAWVKCATAREYCSYVMWDHQLTFDGKHFGYLHNGNGGITENCSKWFLNIIFELSGAFLGTWPWMTLKVIFKVIAPNHSKWPLKASKHYFWASGALLDIWPWVTLKFKFKVTAQNNSMASKGFKISFLSFWSIFGYLTLNDLEGHFQGHYPKSLKMASQGFKTSFLSF